MFVGKHTYGVPTLKWGESGAKVTCGNFCSIAKGVTIYLGGNHRIDHVTTYPFGHINRHIFDSFKGEGHPATKGNVVIGNDVWIADNVTIMSGITIGDGAVIAANSHVVKNVPSYAVVGGNPAKLIRYRFNEQQIENLLKIQWWNWPDNLINQHTEKLCSCNIDDFIDIALQIQQP